MKAIFDGVVLAESDKVVQLEGNNYYPLSSLNMEYFSPIEKTTVCGWKVRARVDARLSARAPFRGGRPRALASAPSISHALCLHHPRIHPRPPYRAPSGRGELL